MPLPSSDFRQGRSFSWLRRILGVQCQILLGSKWSWPIVPGQPMLNPGRCGATTQICTDCLFSWLLLHQESVPTLVPDVPEVHWKKGPNIGLELRTCFVHFGNFKPRCLWFVKITTGKKKPFGPVLVLLCRNLTERCYGRYGKLPVKVDGLCKLTCCFDAGLLSTSLQYQRVTVLCLWVHQWIYEAIVVGAPYPKCLTMKSPWS